MKIDYEGLNLLRQYLESRDDSYGVSWKVSERDRLYNLLLQWASSRGFLVAPEFDTTFVDSLIKTFQIQD